MVSALLLALVAAIISNSATLENDTVSVPGHYKPPTHRLGGHFHRALPGNNRESWFSSGKHLPTFQSGTKTNLFEDVESYLWKTCHHPSCYLLCCKIFGETISGFKFPADQMVLVLAWCGVHRFSTIDIILESKAELIFRILMKLVCSLWPHPMTMW